MSPIHTVSTFAPGRVNLIGDHTDYAGGLVLPMAVGMGTTVRGRRGGQGVSLWTDAYSEGVSFDLPAQLPLRLEGWGRYVEAVAAIAGTGTGFSGHVTSDLPIGVGLASSASLEVAVALALGCEGSRPEIARLGQEAELVASGVPCGIMDQLVSLVATEGYATLIDCSSLSTEPVPVPAEAEFVVVYSGENRRLAGSAYAERRRSCEEAASSIGPLRAATLDAVSGLGDPVLRARARHVVSENARVREFAVALPAGDLERCGRLMVESHRSLAEDFEVSTAALDRLVDDLVGRPGVYGARLTGAGFGGCVVALTRPGAVPDGWRVRPSAGAYVTEG